MSTLADGVREVVRVGPTRVVINPSGEATTPERAARDHGIRPTVIYVRHDGWSLGAPEQFRAVAERMWEDEWTAIIWWDTRAWWWRPYRSNEPPKEV